MVGRLFVFLAFAILSLQGYGQSLPPAYEIKNDTLSQQDVPDVHVMFLAVQA
jgi:hypothetical protein